MESWIESFVKQTADLESPEIFRKWTAISAIAATLEQKVWVKTSRPLYPNLYVLICAHPGVGKTRTIREGRYYVSQLPEFHIAPTSLTWASLVDTLAGSKRFIQQLPAEPLDYNSLYICNDELGALIHKYDNEMIDGLSALYDPDPYHQRRRTNDLKIKIQSPQVNFLAGSTPQNLLEVMPEKAWGQGFTSRLIMIFSDERTVGDDFAPKELSYSTDLAHDLGIINNLLGEFEVSEAYREAVNNWRAMGEIPVPNHPKLLHYITRRRVHLYKLSMISAIDRSNALILTRDDFNRAMGWLLEAESMMPEIFKAGARNADGAALDEIQHFIAATDLTGAGIAEQRIIHFARDKIPVHSILRVIEIMERSGLIHCVRRDKRTGFRYYSVSGQRNQTSDPLQ